MARSVPQVVFFRVDIPEITSGQDFRSRVRALPGGSGQPISPAGCQRRSEMRQRSGAATVGGVARIKVPAISARSGCRETSRSVSRYCTA